MVWPLRKRAQQFLKILKAGLLYVPEILLVTVHPKKLSKVLKRWLHAQVHRGIINSGQKAEQHKYSLQKNT